MTQCSIFCPAPCLKTNYVEMAMQACQDVDLPDSVKYMSQTKLCGEDAFWRKLIFARHSNEVVI